MKRFRKQRLNSIYQTTPRTLRFHKPCFSKVTFITTTTPVLSNSFPLSLLPIVLLPTTNHHPHANFMFFFSLLLLPFMTGGTLKVLVLGPFRQHITQIPDTIRAGIQYQLHQSTTWHLWYRKERSTAVANASMLLLLFLYTTCNYFDSNHHHLSLSLFLFFCGRMVMV